MNEPDSGVTTLFDKLVAPPASTPGPPPTRRRRWPFVVAGLVVVLLALGGGSVLAFRQTVAGYDRKIERFGDPFTQIPAKERPARASSAAALNVLLLGSDSRISAGDPKQWAAGAQRTDAIMMVHVQADRKAAYVVSIPRDSWVEVPGRGMAKINAAFSWGGPALMVRTVEAMTGVQVDHVAVVDFDGFKQLTDDLGGVDIKISAATKDKRATWTPGVHHMDGATALNYVRQRYNLPGGDFDRVKRQQNWIRAVFRKLSSSGTLKNPIALNRALNTLSASVATDSGFTMDRISELVTSLAGVGAGNLRFFTTPTAGTGWSPDGKQSIVKLDRVRGEQLWQAVRKDRVVDWFRTYHPDLLPETLR